MSNSSTNCCIIDALCGIDTSSPQINQYTDSFNQIKFLLKKNMSEYTFMIITDINGYVHIITTDGSTLTKGTDENGHTTLLWKVGSEITVSSGAVTYQIAAYKQSNGETNSVWYSKEGRLVVSESIDTTSYSTAVIGANPNLITKLILQTTNLSDTVNSKVDKIDGKGLSSEDYTISEKEKLATVEKGARANIQSDWNETDETSDAYIKNKPVVDKEINAESDNAVANSVVSQIDKLSKENYDALESHRGDIENLQSDYGSFRDSYDDHRQNLHPDEKHLTDEEKVNVGLLPEKFEQIEFNRMNVETLIEEKADKKSVNERLDELEADMMSEIHPVPVTEVPVTLVPNTAYNFGLSRELSLSFPEIANDGDVIYIMFHCYETPTNLIINTVWTTDIDLIPEVNTGYEIYAKFDNASGYWIVKYSEHNMPGV